MTDTTPATDEEVTEARSYHRARTLYPRECVAQCNDGWPCERARLIARIDTERDRADSFEEAGAEFMHRADNLEAQLAERDADVVALREFIEAIAITDEDGIVIRHWQQEANNLLAQPSPAAGRVLVDAARLTRAMERCKGPVCPLCWFGGWAHEDWCFVPHALAVLDAAGGVK